MEYRLVCICIALIPLYIQKGNKREEEEEEEEEDLRGVSLTSEEERG